ncbi:hypothetical protein LTR95_002454 [Oleoguttula sp. CCFEE 5521]
MASSPPWRTMPPPPGTDMRMARQPAPDIHTEFLIGMDQPPHPRLDDAIADGDYDRLLAEFADIRRRYPHPTVTFNTALDRAIQYENLGILACLMRCGIRPNHHNLEVAIERGSVPVLARLVEGAPESIDMVLENGRTLLG